MRRTPRRSRDETTLEIGFVVLRTATLLLALAAARWLARTWGLTADPVAESVAGVAALVFGALAVGWGVATLVRFDRRAEPKVETVP